MQTSKIIRITSSEHLAELQQDNRVLLIDFYASWCAPCRAIEPLILKLANHFSGITFCKIDVGDQSMSEVVAKYGITSIPCVCVESEKQHFFRNTEEIRGKLEGFLESL